MSLSLAVLPACGSSKPEWPKGNVVLENTNSYTSTTMLTIPQITTASGADLTVCWDSLTKDLLCHDIGTGNDVDNVSFLQIPNMDETEVAAALAVGQLDPNLVKIYRDHHVDHSVTPKCANLSTFMLGTVLNPAVDFVEPAAGQKLTYMLLWESGTTPGVGSKAMAFLEPKASSTVMNVDAPDACTSMVLDFHATLGPAITIPKDDKTKWHVDWSQITHDSFGNPINFGKIDSVQVGFYQNMTPADLEANFKDIELIATKFYEMPVVKGARDADLAMAVEKGTTTPFPGFTETDGTWALAVRCSSCQIPAPVVLSVLQPQ